MLEKDRDLFSCPLKYTLSLLSGKWKALIIWYLAIDDKPVRYSALKRRIPYDISHKVLTQQLKELTKDGIVIRANITSETTPNAINVEYRLSEKGRSLCSIVYLLRDWGMLYGKFDAKERIQMSKGVFYKNMIIYDSESEDQVDHAFDAFVWMRRRPAYRAAKSEDKTSTQTLIA